MSLPICKFYQLNKTCRFGKHCRYAHSSDRPPSLETTNNHEESLKDQVSTGPNFTETNPNSDSACCLKENGTSVSREHLDEKNTEFSPQPIIETDKKKIKENAVVNRASSNKSSRKPLCHFFVSYGNCRYGNDCRFSHQLPRYDDKRNHGSRQRQRKELEVAPRFRQEKVQNVPECVSDETVPNANEIPPLVTRQGSQNNPVSISSKNVQALDDNQKICPYYLSGRCWRADRCRFKHLTDVKSEDGSNTVNNRYRRQVLRKSHNDYTKPLEPNGNQRYIKKDSQQIKSNDRPQYETKRRIITRPLGVKQTFTYSELEDVGLAKVREMELNTIRKRFPKDKISINDGDKWTARLSFSPTDPDWPFDVSVFELLFEVPEDYPKKLMTITLPVDQDLPETVRRYVEISIKEWLEDKKEQLSSTGKVELVFRPFLRWLDRNIEDITTEALQQLKRELLAKAAGFEFIPANRLKDRFRTKSDSSEEHEVQADGDLRERGSDEEDDSSSEEEDDSSDGSSNDENNDGGPNVSLSLDPDKKGTELALQHLQLRENASALLFETLKLILQCQRCKTHSELLVPQNKVMSLRCEKCNQNQFVNYRPALIHQFSSVVGYLDVDGCQAFDLIFQDCRLVVTCLGCSKPTRINGLVTGQMIDGWCQACNARFKLATESVKFSQYVPSGIDTTNKVVDVPSTKTKKPPKDPAIREGCPLPEFGTCKHYKHSYRWLRFPCCGKAYPCDVCHDKKEDHEMILATRMICGHCCKEQNYSGSRPCIACKQHLTKIRSAHWEGGTGCRDKITMSKNDQQKYKNMNKTQSNHKKKVETGASKKKNTKLRHV